MKFMYFFDEKIKRYIMRGKKYCNPSNTGVYDCGVSCIRQADVNMWFYTKNGTTIAIDAGHLLHPDIERDFAKIGIDPLKIKHVLITHADVDHCGGLDTAGENIFPNAQLYLGEKEEDYLKQKIHRMTRFGVKIRNCVHLKPGYRLLKKDEYLEIDGIKIQSIHIPGHTVGHTCYLLDDKVLFSGDCLAINERGGYSFFDFFTQYPDMNKKSLKKLKEWMEKSKAQYICTGHSGIRPYNESTFSHIDESAYFSKKSPFDPSAPYDAFK